MHLSVSQVSSHKNSHSCRLYTNFSRSCAFPRQVDALSGRVDKLPSPEDWNIMEQALAAILDEAAARAQEEDRLAEEAAQRAGGPLGFLEEEEEDEAAQASCGGSIGAGACGVHATIACYSATVLYDPGEWLMI